MNTRSPAGDYIFVAAGKIWKVVPGDSLRIAPGYEMSYEHLPNSLPCCILSQLITLFSSWYASDTFPISQKCRNVKSIFIYSIFKPFLDTFCDMAIQPKFLVCFCNYSFCLS